MKITKTAVGTALGLGASVLTAGASALSDSSTVSIVNAGISIATAIAGFLHLFGAKTAEADVSAAVAAVPVLAPTVAALAPVVESAVKGAVAAEAKPKS